MRNWKEIVMAVCAIACFIATGIVVIIYSGDIANWLDYMYAFWHVMGVVAATAMLGVLAKFLGVDAPEEE